MSEIAKWLQDNRVDEVECLVSDITGIARGKIVPTPRFIGGLVERGLRIPEAVFLQTVTGDFVQQVSQVVSESNRDIYMQPDPSTMRIVPWYPDPVAQVICDAHFLNGEPVDVAPRQLLKRVLAQYEKRDLIPVIAPELEFYLVKKNLDPDMPLEPAAGLSGRQESGRQAYGIEAANDFDPIIEDIYDYCEASRIDIETMAHEAGAAQMEINFNHGDPMELADQVFMFKRTVRQAALKHDMYATFMARPHQFQPGSSMHIHQSILDKKTGRNIFATERGKISKKLHHYIGGLQRYTPAAMPLFAPNVNSYRRLTPYSDAPINTHWGVDNRTVGLRVPDSKPDAFRVENRVAGADANPYLAIAGTLACGLIGLKEKLEPTKPIDGDAYRLAFTLPRHQQDALYKMNHSRPLKDILGDRFVKLMTEVKMHEFDLYQQVISSWERENLLLNV